MPLPGIPAISSVGLTLPSAPSGRKRHVLSQDDGAAALTCPPILGGARCADINTMGGREVVRAVLAKVGKAGLIVLAGSLSAYGIYTNTREIRQAREDGRREGETLAKATLSGDPKPVSTDAPVQRVQSAPTLKAAVAAASPYFEDRPNESGYGTELLLAWAARSMTWADVGVAADETTFARVLKDPEEERGKRLCASGEIIEIAAEKSELGKTYAGLLMSDAWDLFRFHAVRSSGTLVAKSRARFCGVVTGRFDYANSAGGVGHAVKLVGMFDLPENRGGGTAPATATTADTRPASKPPTGQATPSTSPKLARLKQCCSALSNEAKRMANSPEAGMFASASAQCNTLAAQAAPSGDVPDLSVVRNILSGRTLPTACAGL